MVPAQFIVIVILRLYAVYWAFQGLGALVGVVFGKEWGYFTVYIAIVNKWLGAAIAWVVAPKLARMMVGNSEVAMAAPNLRRRDLYAAALVGVGAYVVLQSVARTFNWIHFFIVSKNQSFQPANENAPGFYDFAENAITLVAGLAVFFWAGDLAKKMDGSDGKSDDSKKNQD